MNLQEFLPLLEARNPCHVNYFTDACDWFFGDIQCFHERSYWPHSPFVKMSVKYWGEIIYFDLNKAEIDAKRLNGKVQKSFYCDDDNPNWFIIFSNFEDAAKHALENLNLNRK